MSELFDAGLVGIYSRSPGLVRATRDFDRKRISEEELGKAYEADAKKLIQTQTSLGFDYVSDGQLKWQDHFRPFSENLESAKVGSLTRYYENNTFFKKPVIHSNIEPGKKGFIEKYFFTELFPHGVKKKAILPSPYYFVNLAEVNGYKNSKDAMFDFAKALHSAAKELEAQGFGFIQFNDPALTYNAKKGKLGKETLHEVKEAFEIATKGLKAKTSLHTYFGDFNLVAKELLEFHVDGFGIDFTETDLSKLTEHDFSGKELTLGLIDAQNSLIEPVSEIVEKARGFANKVQAKKYYVSSNLDLEYVPYSIAEKKLANLGAALKKLRGN